MTKHDHNLALMNDAIMRVKRIDQPLTASTIIAAEMQRDAEMRRKIETAYMQPIIDRCHKLLFPLLVDMLA